MMDESIIKEFLAESHEELDQLEQDLVILEEESGNQEVIDRIFRTVHNIKGSSGVLGFSKLDSVSHTGENLLSRIRDGKILPNTKIISVLLKLVDALREMLNAIQDNNNEGDGNYSDLIDELNILQKQESSDSEEIEETSADDLAAEENLEPKEEENKESIKNLEQENQNDIKIEEVIKKPVKVEQKEKKLNNKKEAEKVDNSKARKESLTSWGLSETNIRVDVSILDKLMNLVGELVLTRNQILQFANSQQGGNFTATSQRLNIITSELQESVMKTRMQPIGNIWNKFPRVVRDLATSSGKYVRLEMVGKETELDKSLIEAIKAPLTHLIRNAVDHGIEKADIRKARGKNPEGCIYLRSYHESGQVTIEISDDGGGIDPQKVKEKALTRSLISQDQAFQMNEMELINLIFLPGFSTSEKVTNVSGRGVGMDVVKTNIEKLGGMIDIQNKVGHGTTFKMKIPLTLAIIPALVVTCRKDRYAIPQLSLVELIRVEGENIAKRIEKIHNAPVYRLRGHLLPLVYLSKELKLKEEENEKQIINIVVLQADDRQFGVVVDEINDTQEIVVKPLGKQIKNISIFAGATIMGDGHVSLILDVLGLAQRANVISKKQERKLLEKAEKENVHTEKKDTLLLFKVGEYKKLAIQLSIVARLEEISREKVEKAGDFDVIQYRGEIMPLIYLNEIFGFDNCHDSSENMKVIVYNNNNRSMGLVVENIIDIIETTLQIQKCNNRTGIHGSAVVQNQIVDILDIESVIATANPPFFEENVQENLSVANDY